MTEGNLELVHVVASWAVTLPAVVAIIRRDERRLRGVELERAWPPVSRDAAIFALWNFFGLHPFAVVIHFVRTRLSFRGWALGFGWLAGIVAASVAAQLGVETAIDWLGL